MFLATILRKVATGVSFIFFVLCEHNLKVIRGIACVRFSTLLRIPHLLLCLGVMESVDWWTFIRIKYLHKYCICFSVASYYFLRFIE